jgi:hypothetical protein
LIQYSGGAGLKAGYCRQCSVSLTVDILPSLLINNWMVTYADRFFFFLHIFCCVFSQVQVQLSLMDVDAIKEHHQQLLFVIVNCTSLKLELSWVIVNSNTIPEQKCW